MDVHEFYNSNSVNELTTQVFDHNKKLDELYDDLTFINQWIDEYKEDRDATYYSISDSKSMIEHCRDSHLYDMIESYRDSISDSYDHLEEIKAKLDEQYAAKAGVYEEIETVKEDLKSTRGRLISLLVKSGICSGIKLVNGEGAALDIHKTEGKWVIKYTRPDDNHPDTDNPFYISFMSQLKKIRDSVSK